MKEYFEKQLATPLLNGAPLVFLEEDDKGAVGFKGTSEQTLDEDLAAYEFVKMSIDGQTPVFRKRA